MSAINELKALTNIGELVRFINDLGWDYRKYTPATLQTGKYGGLAVAKYLQKLTYSKKDLQMRHIYRYETVSLPLVLGSSTLKNVNFLEFLTLEFIRSGF